MSLNGYKFAQQGTLWVIAANGTPGSDISVTLSVNGTTEIYAPYTIRSGVIAPQMTDVYSFGYIFPCDAEGNDQSTVPGTSIPFTQFTINSNSLTAVMSFGSGGVTGNVAGFGIKLCVWSTSSLDSSSVIPMQLIFGALNSYDARFLFQTKGTEFTNAPNLISGFNSVPWGTGQGTATGLTNPAPPNSNL